MTRADIRQAQAEFDAQRTAAFEKQQRDEQAERRRMIADRLPPPAPAPAPEPEPLPELPPLPEVKVKDVPDVLTERITGLLRKQRLNSKKKAARDNAATFLAHHPEFYAVEENLDTITNWMIRNKLSPTVSNFERAYLTLNVPEVAS